MKEQLCSLHQFCRYDLLKKVKTQMNISPTSNAMISRTLRPYLPGQKARSMRGAGATSFFRASERYYQKDPKSEASAWYILTIGLPKPTREHTFAQGIVLRPFQVDQQVPLPFPKELIKWIESSGARTLIDIAGEHCTSEIIVKRIPELSKANDLLSHVWVASALLVLRGFISYHGIMCKTNSWEEPNMPGSITPLDYSMNYLSLDSAPKEFREEDAEWVNSNSSRANEIIRGSGVSALRFKAALQAAYDWRYCNDMRQALIELWSGIEALVNHDKAKEITQRIATICAKLLSPNSRDENQRIEHAGRIYSLVQKSYNARSLGNHARTDKELSDGKIEEAVRDSFELLQKLICLQLTRTDGGELGKGGPFTAKELRKLLNPWATLESKTVT